MSSPTESKKSSAKSSEPRTTDQQSKPKARIQKRILLTKSLWDGWAPDEIQQCEFEGLKFQAVKNPDNAVLYTGESLEMVKMYGTKSWKSKDPLKRINPFTMNGAQLPTSGSCAYPRFYPAAQTNEVAAMYRWWLWNLYIPRGSIAFVTHKDAGGMTSPGWEARLEYLHETLKRRGFKVTCVNKSNHTGHYPVWLYTHPGDDVLLAERNKKNKKEAVNDVDVLGSADAGVPGLGVAGYAAERNAAAPAVPDAYTLAA
jgi:hypothetical protein